MERPTHVRQDVSQNSRRSSSCESLFDVRTHGYRLCVEFTPPDLGEIAPSAVVRLARRLRQGGLAVSTSETLDAVRALGAIDVTRRREVREALKLTLVKDARHDALFQQSFDEVFPRLRKAAGAPPGRVEGNATTNVSSDALVEALRQGDEQRLDALLDDAIDRHAGPTTGERTVGHYVQRTLRSLDLAGLYRRYLDSQPEDSDADRALRNAEANAAMVLLRRRLEQLVWDRVGPNSSPPQMQSPEDQPLLRAGPDELAAMRQAMRPLARRLAAHLGSRRRRGKSALDMRRTIRSSMSTGGTPAQPILRRRRPTKPDLVVLCDVSGSTAQFAPFTLTLLHAVHQEFRRVRSFVFADGIVEITDVLATSPGVLDPHHLLGRKGLIATDGRSDYQRALATFLATWGDSVSAKTTVIIAGDARSHDRGSASREIAELQHRSRRIYWLNPEPRIDWDSDDSRASEYADLCTATFEVSTIRQLAVAVARIA